MGSAENSVALPFWKIAHQMVLDLRCLHVIYIGITETVRRFENPMIGSGLRLGFSFSLISDLFFGRVEKQGETYA